MRRLVSGARLRVFHTFEYLMNQNLYLSTSERREPFQADVLFGPGEVVSRIQLSALDG